jgi:hypothetical protein
MEKIIGIIFGKKSTPWQRIDADGNAIDVAAGEFDAHPVYAGIQGETIDEQQMVRVPAFYYRAGRVAAGEFAGKKALWISDEPAEGFALHPAFVGVRVELDQFWVGKYQATPDGDKMGSRSGLMPLANIDFPAMQQAAAARNEGDVSGFGLWSIYHLGAIQTLALIELGTPDARSILGDGYVNGNGARPVDDEVVAQATWRGIVGLWGNVWQMVDGLQTDEERRYRIWDAEGGKSYVSTGVKAPASGWFHRRARKQGEGFDMGAVFVAKKTREDSDDSAFGNYFWAWENAVAYHGGRWSGGAGAGLFYLTVYNAASDSSPGIGGRLAKV